MSHPDNGSTTALDMFISLPGKGNPPETMRSGAPPRGSMRYTAHALFPAREVRSTSQAPPTPISTHNGTVISTGESVLNSNSPTRGRNTKVAMVSHPTLAVATTTNPSGSREKAAIKRLKYDEGPRAEA